MRDVRALGSSREAMESANHLRRKRPWHGVTLRETRFWRYAVWRLAHQHLGKRSPAMVAVRGNEGTLETPFISAGAPPLRLFAAFLSPPVLTARAGGSEL